MKSTIFVWQALIILIFLGCGSPASFIEQEISNSDVEINPDQIINDGTDPGINQNSVDDPGQLADNPGSSDDPGVAINNPDSSDDPGIAINNPDNQNPGDQDPNNPFDPNNVTDPEDPNSGTTSVSSLSFNGEAQQIFTTSSFNTGDRFATEKLKLLAKNKTQTLNLSQINREQISDKQIQGDTGTQNSENFMQSQDEKKLDILVVVDNSGSMSQEQVNLASKLSPLLSYVQDTDWRIAVNTTDAADPCIKAIINKDDSNVNTRFSDAVNDGISGSGTEQGILRAVQGLKSECLNSSWVRQDSHLAVLIVSDEDNCSKGDCTGSDINEASYLTNYLASQRVLGTSAKVYGLVWHPSQTSSQCSTAYNQANIYAEAISQSNGTWGSICDSDYSQTLSAMSNELSSSLNTQFALAEQPDMNKFDVYINQVLQSSSTYNVEKNILKFVQAPQQNAKIRVDYSFGGTTIITDMNLSEQPDTSTLEVYVDNTKLKSSEYTYAASSNKVTLKQLAGDGEEIKVSYRKYSILPTRFNTSVSGEVLSMNVTVNGTLNTTYVYNKTSGTITFSQAPADGSSIEVNTIQNIGVQSDYTFSPGANTQIIAIVDENSGDQIGYEYTNSIVSISESELVEGRSVVIEYQVPGVHSGSNKFTMANLPIENTISVRSNGVRCTNFTVSNKVVDISNCSFGSSNNAKIDVSYKYLDDKLIASFVFTKAISSSYEDVSWTVYVDGVETSNYSRSGNIITLDQGVMRGVLVKIEARY